MRILFVTPAADNAHVVKWVNSALSFGHEIEMMCHVPSKPLEGVPTHVVSTDTNRTSKIFGRIKFVLTCRSVIRRFRPDLVHVHFMDPTLTVLGWAKFRPLLISVWGSDVALPRNMVNELFRRHGLRSADRLTATNPLLEYMARAHVGLEAKIDIIPFGVDLNLFKPDSSVSSDQFVIGYVKHLEPIYGYDTLIRAMPRVIDEVPSAILKMVGSGSRLSQAKALVETLGLRDKVCFMGRVPNQDLPSLFRSFNVVAMPSLSESFGVSALEASACGIPVVASRVGGIPDVVRHLETGILVVPRDPVSLAQSLIRLAKDPQECRLMGQAGRELVVREFNWDDCAAAMESVYQQMVSTHD